MAEQISEREMGRILESLSELNRRMGGVEVKVDALTSAYSQHPAQCFVEMRKMFVNREEFESFASFVRTVRNVMLIGFLAAVGSAIVIGIKTAQAYGG